MADQALRPARLHLRHGPALTVSGASAFRATHPPQGGLAVAERINSYENTNRLLDNAADAIGLEEEMRLI